MQQAETWLQKKRMHRRHKNLEEINFKFKGKQFSYQEKNNFIEYHIESSIKKFNIHLTQEDKLQHQKMYELRNQILRNELKYHHRKLKAEREERRQAVLRKLQTQLIQSKGGIQSELLKSFKTTVKWIDRKWKINEWSMVEIRMLCVKGVLVSGLSVIESNLFK